MTATLEQDERLQDLRRLYLNGHPAFMELYLCLSGRMPTDEQLQEAVQRYEAERFWYG